MLACWNAWRTQNSRRFARGWLYLTNYRVAFQPRPYSEAFEGEYWHFRLCDIDDVRRLPKDGSQILGGSFRDRMLIQLGDGIVHLFVVRDLDEVMERIRAAVKETWL